MKSLERINFDSQTELNAKADLDATSNSKGGTISLERLVVSVASDHKATLVRSEYNTDVVASQQLNKVLCRPMGQESVAGVNFDEPAVVENLAQCPTHISSISRCFCLVKDVRSYVDDVSKHGLLSTGRIDSETFPFMPAGSEDRLEIIYQALFDFLPLFGILRRDLEVRQITGFQLHSFGIGETWDQRLRTRRLVRLMLHRSDRNQVEYESLSGSLVLVRLRLEDIWVGRVQGELSLILVDSSTTPGNSIHAKKEAKLLPGNWLLSQGLVTNVENLVTIGSMTGIPKEFVVNRPPVKTVAIEARRLRVRVNQNVLGILGRLNASIRTAAVQLLEVLSSTAGADWSLPNSHAQNATGQHRYYDTQPAVRDLLIDAAMSLATVKAAA